MQYSQAKQGRVFVIRLEDGDILHESVEHFAEANGITAAALIVLGGADQGSRLICGPRQGRVAAIEPLEQMLTDVHEAVGAGTLFPDESGKPALHMHLSCGRAGQTTTGCVRRGVRIWHVMEVVLFELVSTPARRITDPAIGFQLLRP